MSKRKRICKDLLEVTLGVFMMAFSYYFFFSPSNLCNGGVSGLTIIIKNTPIGQFSWYRDWMFMYTAQVILLICALLFVGKDFFLKTILACILDPTFNLIFERCGANPVYFLQVIPTSNWYLISMLVGGL